MKIEEEVTMQVLSFTVVVLAANARGKPKWEILKTQQLLYDQHFLLRVWPLQQPKKNKHSTKYNQNKIQDS